jgi:hypothetical protein
MTTQQHPITPPPMLVAKLWREASAGRDDAPIGEIFSHGVYLAYRAGADQELEACCELMDRDFMAGPSDLRAARRPSPKPPSLKEQALALIDECTDPEGDYLDDNALSIIRRALEALPND